MKYRVRADLSFDKEADARALLVKAQGMIGKARNMNEGLANEETAFCELELSGADEGKPSFLISRTERKTIKEVA